MHYKSKEVRIGNISVGGSRPVVLQSMTNTSTMDVVSSAEQAMRIADAGAGMVRLTAQNIKEAEKLKDIKALLTKKGYDIPLVADIHFNPRAALKAAIHVEKVRINPGNYCDSYKKDKVEFSEEEYRQELERIKERLQPLVEACKQHHTAMRIGSNHGSLSQRIMSRYGDTPEGMAESAMEFLRLCHQLNYHNIVVSMKSSNTQVMTEATLLTVKKMQSEKLMFPLHLGVTEAGDGLEGRIKSALGIGGLLLHGIGDTIRVSLTEPPERELPAAKTIAATAEKHNLFSKKFSIPAGAPQQTKKSTLAGKPGPWVILSTPPQEKENVIPADFYFHKDMTPPFDYHLLKEDDDVAAFTPTAPVVLDGSLRWQWQSALLFAAKSPEIPLILKKHSEQKEAESYAAETATELSIFLYYNLLDGLWLENKWLSHDTLSRISFAILQASGKRITKTEYISCPSCGRTQFDIERALLAVKSRTAHLKGLKIGVMGCVVNGPGEMADADYGYVGSGKGRVTLYKGKEVKHKNIPENEALEMLVSLIKKEGDWKVRNG
jgi:(E)-4-hydroxy-3-methylbut-2-enyl-diphosphate synthase